MMDRWMDERRDEGVLFFQLAGIRNVCFWLAGDLEFIV